MSRKQASLKAPGAYRELTPAPISAPEPKANVGPAAPAGGNGSPKRCKRCGLDNAAAAYQCVRCGCFLRGNGSALTHGISRYQATGVLPPDLRVSVDEFRDGLISDQGGLADLSTVRAGLCRLLVDCETAKRLLLNEVIRRGIDSRPGRVAFDRMLGTIDRWQRIAASLGLERRAKRVPSSFSEAILQAPEVIDE